MPNCSKRPAVLAVLAVLAATWPAPAAAGDGKAAEPGASPISPDGAVLDASARLAAGDFATARDQLASLLAAGHFAPEAFVLLGNAHYRLGEPAAAALNYRRALALDPRHPEAQQNLRFLRREVGFSDLPVTGAAAFATSLGGDTWSIILAAGTWLAALGVAAVVFLRHPNVPALAAVAFAGSVAAATATTALVLRARVVAPVSQLAVVTGDGTDALTAPAVTAPPVLRLPPGSEVRVLVERGSWVYAAAGDESRGWVGRDHLAPLWPFPAGVVEW
jgi:hypothetical protein